MSETQNVEEESRGRKPNFSNKETGILLREYQKGGHVLQVSSTGRVIPKRMGTTFWRMVAEEVNKVSETTRSHLDVKKKFQDFRIAVRKKRSGEIKATKVTGSILWCSFLKL